MTPEIEDYWQRALQALRTAEALIESDPDASASGAYYAAFYAASALLAFQQQTFSKHTALERAIHRDLVKSGAWSIEAGAAFSWLANLRYTGDYGGQDHVSPGEARTALEKARLVLAAAGSAAPEPLPET